jgi:hypothetical protein
MTSMTWVTGAGAVARGSAAWEAGEGAAAATKAKAKTPTAAGARTLSCRT